METIIDNMDDEDFNDIIKKAGLMTDLYLHQYIERSKQSVYVLKKG